MRFLTDRLVIRSYTLADAERRHRSITGDPEVMRVSPRGPMADVDATRQGLARLIEHERRRGFSLWALEERASGAYVGECGLLLVELVGPEVEVAYRLARDRWGRGYATEAAGACIARGLGPLGLERIVALTAPDHVASRRVMEKCGMRFVGPSTYYGLDLVKYAKERTPRP